MTPPRKTCPICGAAAVGLRYCASEECRRESHRRRARAFYRRQPENALEVRECKRCGREFAPNHASRLFCTAKCMRRFHARPKCGSTRDARRRARHFGVEYEWVNAAKVFARDGWRCQICGKAAPEKLRGTMTARAPELDHRVPMALGGGHTYSNVQCAHRACNMKKGAGASLGQLPLFEVPRRRRSLARLDQVVGHG